MVTDMLFTFQRLQDIVTRSMCRVITGNLGVALVVVVSKVLLFGGSIYCHGKMFSEDQYAKSFFWFLFKLEWAWYNVILFSYSCKQEFIHLKKLCLVQGLFWFQTSWTRNIWFDLFWPPFTRGLWFFFPLIFYVLRRCVTIKPQTTKY